MFICENIFYILAITTFTKRLGKCSVNKILSAA